MNVQDIFNATVSHQPHDQWLCYADFTPELLKQISQRYGISSGEDIESHFGMRSWRNVGAGYKDSYIAPDFSKYFSDMDVPADAFINGLGVLEIPAHYYHFTGYVSPLRNATSIQDLEDFPYPDADHLDFSKLKSHVEEAHAAGYPAEIWTGHMYEDSWQIRGYEEFLEDMMLQPEMCEFILDRLCERNLKVAQEAARAGADIIRSGDDVANQISLMFSPEKWRKLMKSRWAKVYEAARQIKPDIQIWYHSDGNIMDIIPELIEISVTILNPVQPECLDVAEVKKQFGSRVVFDGTLGTQTVLPFGTPDDVRNTVRAMKRIAGEDGALILSPTHILEPEVPLDNIEAFFEACHE